MDRYLDLQLFAQPEEEVIPEAPKEVIQEETQEPLVNDPETEPEPPKEPQATDPEPLAPQVKKGYAPTPEQLARLNKLTKRELTAEEVAYIPLKFIGDGLIQERMFAIEDKALQDLAEYANKGVSFLLDHQWANWFGNQIVFPFGRTLDAKVEKSREEDGTPDNEEKALYGHIYIVKGKEINGITTDTVIASFEDGTLSDVSVTFSVSKYVCSICGKSIWDDDCEHAIGKVYDGKLCYLIGKAPARLYEISGVWDGAYPSAKALSADEIESEYEEVTDIKAAKDADLLHVYSSTGFHTFKKREKTAPVVTPTIDEAKAKEIAGENWQENIFKLASDAKSLRDDLVEDTLEWGVRANGIEHFKRDEYEILFRDMDIPRIKSFREMWEKQAREAIPAGRKIISEQTQPPREIPDDAYKMRKRSQ